ncbi:MAG TPA: M48 family metallopeptidase [Aquabacterium sp.]|uniref:M48 family metallopeptidase n=1 Tax=Aquabacterium sp. TaxID=1872578 RepID=UPI002E31E1CF|nr:M48 family metallopeptidase [Aquabacterium sp.]HEX5373442.1 M48 family metallopeptidase [Aquabacterium sp.]
MNMSFVQAPVVTVVFATLLLATLLVKLWLSSRQIRHVALNRSQVPAAFAQSVSLESHQRAADYTIAKLRFGLLSTAVGTATLVAWTLLGGLDALNALLLDTVRPHLGDLGYQLVLLLGFSVIGALIDLPLELWNTFRLEQRYGFNRMTPKLWLIDLIKSTVLGLAIGGPIAALVLWLMGAAGTYWWLWAWAVWVGFSLLMMVIFPTLIAPLFNKFQPLQDDALKTRVEGLMQRCGFASKGLFVMDGSRRSAHANAYFTGLGAAKRVVFFDTLLSRLSPGEVEAVLAHELGHFKHKHVLKRMIGLFGLSLLAFWLLGWLSQQVGFYLGLGVRPNLDGANNAMAILLFMMSVPLATFFIAPLLSTFSRRDEFQADAYACAHARGQDLAQALVKLYEDNASTLTPDPLYVRFYYSHPPASERLARVGQLST